MKKTLPLVAAACLVSAAAVNAQTTSPSTAPPTSNTQNPSTSTTPGAMTPGTTTPGATTAPRTSPGMTNSTTGSTTGTTTGTTGSASTTTSSGVTAAGNAVTLTDEQARNWIDKVIYSSDGQNLGEVAAFARDSSGKVTELHGDIGGLMGMAETRVRIMPDQFRLENDRVTLNMTKEQTRTLPVITKAN